MSLTKKASQYYVITLIFGALFSVGMSLLNLRKQLIIYIVNPQLS
jgi:hypothetical protein